jgi:hypothetical protein
MKNKVTFMLMALGVALPVMSLQAQDSERPARPGAGPRPDRPAFGLYGALDANRDRTIDKSEISGATEALKKLDKDNDGKLTAAELRGGPAGAPGEGRGPRGEGANAERRGPRNDSEERAGQRPRRGGEGGGAGAMMAGGPLHAALDANNDRTIDADEMKGAPAALLKLDKNNDGQLTIEEIAPARGNRGAGQPGERPNRERRGQRGSDEQKSE